MRNYESTKWDLIYTMCVLKYLITCTLTIECDVPVHVCYQDIQRDGVLFIVTHHFLIVNHYNGRGGKSNFTPNRLGGGGGATCKMYFRGYLKIFHFFGGP